MSFLTSTDFDYQKKLAAWNAASTDPKYDARVFRHDRFGWWMKWSDYGNRNSEYGWEVDHIVPIAKGGADALGNVQALHWRNNVVKSDKL